jgi:Holliday junction DNA helicase RuvA
VLEQDVATLVAVPGVGRKTAERLLVELKGKVEQLSGAVHSDVDADAVAALLALGYRRQPAGDAVRASRPDAGNDLQGLIRMSLKRLSA